MRKRSQQKDQQGLLQGPDQGKAVSMQEIDDIIAAADGETGEIPEEEENASSWTVGDDAAIKQTDRHTFLYRETIVPPAVLEFFGAAGLEPGRKKRIVLLYGGRRFEARIEKTVHTPPRSRMLWKADFGAVLAAQYPEWAEYFRKNRAESGDTPALRFVPGREPGLFVVEPEGEIAAEPDREFTVPLEPGDTIDNDALHAIFRCSLLGPLRRSPATGSLVLVADHTGDDAGDTWIGKVFHFTGMGEVGEQSPAARQNRTLAESREKGIRLFLFEVFGEGRYTFDGEAELMDNPYRSRQPDSAKVMRDVWVFPLRLKGNKNPPLHRKDAEIAPVPAPAGRPGPGSGAESAPAAAGDAADLFEPEQLVPEYVRRRANGACELCGLPAPFSGRDGKPYLELHHLIPVKEGGADSIANTVALCPNCHRKMHVLGLDGDLAILKERVERE